MSDNRNRVYSKAVLAEGTTAACFKTTTNVLFYTINGIMYSKAATDNLTFSAGHTSMAASQQCVFGVCLDSAGNATTVQGPIKTVGDDSAVLAWPEAPVDKCLIGGIIVETGATTFVPGTTDLGAANVTDTYVDCDGAPPQTVNLY